MKNVVILGSKGALGGQLLKLYPGATGWDREDADVTDFPTLRDKIAGLERVPEAIINCVAFNDVDGAEDCPEQAFLLNAEVPGELARIARELEIGRAHV